MRLLKNIQRVKQAITVHSNTGKSTTNLVGKHPEQGWVWFDPKRIANILSLKQMSRKHRTTYNSEGGSALCNTFIVHRGNTPLRFAASKVGLYTTATQPTIGTPASPLLSRGLPPRQQQSRASPWPRCAEHTTPGRSRAWPATRQMRISTHW